MPNTQACVASIQTSSKGINKIAEDTLAPIQMKKSAIVAVINSLLIYEYVGGREGVNPDPDKVRTSLICSLVLWPQEG